ncbi:ATP-binding cassette domain-containing protein [Fructilactobacillus myrtifloralis]|uniref:ATP-binding cassette domain-containing protein n=1 Tax=Fructilactobacillus myrtifloralis TaxID=2940301 RepID=A0ABY5BQB6_9LACO|nr:ATP-binding cassette domain-containing protein [Fructilactobacillus myrtifloralis]USS85760.1 ATP-binding cassette domain-containing protein [Fructilactobacillus myrtifloralis]
MHQLETHHLCYTVDDRQIIQDINWSIDPGAVVTITGPSGSGKSTFVKLLAYLLNPTSGTITFEDQPLDQLDPITYRRAVSYAVQQPTLFGDTVRENLEFPYQIRKQPFDEQHVIQALQTVDLGAADLDRQVTSLSGGEKQRIALLRNVLFPPKVLITDEVTTGLDNDSKQSVHKMLDYFNHKYQMTVIMITHDDAEINAAEHLYELKAGQMQEVAKHE